MNRLIGHHNHPAGGTAPCGVVRDEGTDSALSWLEPRSRKENAHERNLSVAGSSESAERHPLPEVWDAQPTTTIATQARSEATPVTREHRPRMTFSAVPVRPGHRRL